MSRISIHALREEGDAAPTGDFYENRCISIHALREEGDNSYYVSCDYGTQFLSTPSARRATFARRNAKRYEIVFLSTPSARRATLPSMGRVIR